MGEFVGRLIVRLLATVFLVPIVLFFATPYVLLVPIFRDVPERNYWAAVGDGYWRLVKRTLDWGSGMLEL